MLIIRLHHLQFKAYHGLYEQEKINGNDFEVNAEIYHHPVSTIKNIQETINYELVYRLIEERMQIPTPLLETIVMEIAGQILHKFELAEEVTVSIKKINPPIEGMNGSVGVHYHLKRKANDEV
ncbi:MAG: dihydroneopterin aldolase [Sphingobacteriia bacterium]|nr:dihydroneopterin aldolase [Sphingobacteriia bacterium]